MSTGGADGPFERLHPAVQFHIVNSLGWPTLRHSQLEAIDPVLSGRDCLILAPTAGGKTEAALFPVLSRMLTEEWTGLSVLYVCPLKALLNNLEQRLSRYAGLVGRRVAIWHGDVSPGTKAKALREPPDILLTTPESLEGMLISLRVDRQAWLGALRVAIVDELHAFAGDDRGWHLRAVLKRVEAFAPGRLQRLGLSATVGNPAELLRWLAGNDSGVVVGAAAPSSDAEVVVDFVGSLENAAIIISRLYRGRKRLVFCDSRARVELLAVSLRGLGTRTFVSHASLSASERRQAEQAFAEDNDCVIVATSTLELGIDVGDLDHVIQIDAPSTVSSFLQRMGRTGRRAGTRRNCLFLTTHDEALLLAGGITRLWREGHVEPVIPPPEPWHIVAQQAMALVLQTAGVPAQDCLCRLIDLFPELSEEGVKAVLQHMVTRDVLWEEHGLLSFGRHGEATYGRKNFLDLVSSFTSSLLFLVRYGSTDLGYVDPVSIETPEGARPVLLLGGHRWAITSTDWSKRVIWVEPTAQEGKARWLGSSRSLSFVVCQAIKRTLYDAEGPEGFSRRAQARFSDLREDLPTLDVGSTTWQRLDQGRVKWWTFAGGRANGALAAALRARGAGVKVDDFAIEISGQMSSTEVSMAMSDFDANRFVVSLADTGKVRIKFSDCLPVELLTAMALERVLDWETAARVAEAAYVAE